MKHEAVDTPIGPATAIFNKGQLYILDVPSRDVGTTRYQLAALNLYMLEGAKDPDEAARLIAETAQAFVPWAEQLEHYHAEAMARLRQDGWPETLALPNGWFQYQAVPRHEGVRVEILLYAAGPHLQFHISDQGVMTAHYDAATLKQAIDAAISQRRRAQADPVTHKVFGVFKPDDLVRLKRKKLAGRFVTFELYVPEDKIDAVTSETLDGFVPVFDHLADHVEALRPALAALREDWAADWLHPLNSDRARAFHAAFPQAGDTGQITQAAFVDQLWVSRVCLCPFGRGEDRREDRGEAGAQKPVVTWDFHALPKGRDDTIFVAVTDPAGQLICVTTES
ncbi:MAG: hypothetical protein AB8B82_16965 [Roseovarius sp.]